MVCLFETNKGLGDVTRNSNRNLKKEKSNEIRKASFAKVYSAMISHETLYSLANSLGGLAVLAVVAYHVVAVNEKHLSREAANGHDQ